MAWITQASANATDGKMIRTPTGNAVFLNGAFYVLQTPLTAQATNTASTLFTNDTTLSASTNQYPTVNFGVAPYQNVPGSTRILPAGCLTAGTMFNADFLLVCTTTANNLTLTVGLIGPYPATTYTIISTTGAVSASAYSAGAFGHLNFGLSVTTTGTSGSLTGFINFEYGPAGTTISGPVSAVTFDTTQQYTLDCRATWSGGSNSLQLAYGAIEVIG
jgi:hypothetical protein